MGKLPGVKKSYAGIRPACEERSCNKNIDGHCAILTDTDFKGKPCPFKKKGREGANNED